MPPKWDEPEVFELAGGVKLCLIPDWFRDKRITEYLSWGQKQDLEDQRALLVEYEAEALDDPDPDWKEDPPRSIQAKAAELIQLSNLSLWLAKPSSIGFELLVHCQILNDQGLWQSMADPNSILPHERDVQNILSESDLYLARELNEALLGVPRSGTIWTATRMLWSALLELTWEVRYILFWIVLEALFGPSDPREITYRLSQRIGLFLASDRITARDIYHKAKRGYKWRSKVVHGRRLSKLTNEEASEISYFTEKRIREAFIRILGDSRLRDKFDTIKREKYLDELVFGN